MLNNFVGSFARNFGEKLSIVVITPAFIFWCGCFIVLIDRIGWQVVEKWFLALSDSLKILFFVCLYIVINISVSLIRSVDLLVIKILEGYYWPSCLRNAFINWQLHKLEKLKNSGRRLGKKKRSDQISREEFNKYLEIESKIRSFPFVNERMMPTRLGNILSAAESKPLSKYGLNTIVCWPHLWFLLPDSVKRDLVEANEQLRTKCHIWIWSMIFTFTSFWSWWSAPLGVLLAFIAYIQMLDTALMYGKLIEACFDNYRNELYIKLRWPLPNNPSEEKELGEQLTAYLWRGSDKTLPTFENVKNSEN